MNGARMLARIVEAPPEARFALMERKSLFEGVNNYVGNAAGQKLYMHFTDKTELNICVEYVPLRDGEGIRAPWTYTSLDEWTASDNGTTASALSGANVIVKIGSPNAYVNGIRTFVEIPHFQRFIYIIQPHGLKQPENCQHNRSEQGKGKNHAYPQAHTFGFFSFFSYFTDRHQNDSQLLSVSR